MSINSYSGLIVFRASYNRPIEYLLQIDTYTDHKHYSPPKGRIIGEEQEKKVALWSVTELTGMSINDVSILDNFRAALQYLHKNEIKNVTLRLGRVLDYRKSLKIGSNKSGILLEWLKIDDAVEKALYPSMQKILRKADEYISSISDSWFKDPPSEIQKWSHAQTKNDKQNQQYTNPHPKNFQPSNYLAPETSSRSFNQPEPQSLTELSSRFSSIRVTSPKKQVQRTTLYSPTDYSGDWADDYEDKWTREIPSDHSLSLQAKPSQPENKPQNQSQTHKERENHYGNSNRFLNQYQDEINANGPFRQNYRYQNKPFSPTNGHGRSKANSGISSNFNNTSLAESGTSILPQNRNIHTAENTTNNNGDENGNNNDNANNLTERNLYKTRLCQMFESTGECRYGNKCVFAHTKKELLPINKNTVRPLQKNETKRAENYQGAPNGSNNNNTFGGTNKFKPNSRYKQKLCSFFEAHGQCVEGDNCNYAHGAAELQPSSPNTSQNSGSASAYNRNSSYSNSSYNNPGYNNSNASNYSYNKNANKSGRNSYVNNNNNDYNNSDSYNQSRFQNRNQNRGQNQYASQSEKHTRNPAYTQGTNSQCDQNQNISQNDNLSTSLNSSYNANQKPDFPSQQYQSYSRNQNVETSSTKNNIRSGNFFGDSKPFTQPKILTRNNEKTATNLKSAFETNPFSSVNYKKSTVYRDNNYRSRTQPSNANNNLSDSSLHNQRNYSPQNNTWGGKTGIGSMNQFIPKTGFNPQFSSKADDLFPLSKPKIALPIEKPTSASNPKDNLPPTATKTAFTKYEPPPAAAHKIPSPHPASNTALKPNPFIAEAQTIQAFQKYFYGSESSKELIKRPLNEELKEINRVEFRLNLSKRQLLISLICSIFTPFEGRVPKPFIQNRIQLLKKVATSKDQVSIFQGFNALYYSGQLSNKLESHNNSNKSVWSSGISNLLMAFYYEDMIEEEDFLQWYNINTKENNEPALQSMKSFAEWLKNAEEE